MDVDVDHTPPPSNWIDHNQLHQACELPDDVRADEVRLAPGRAATPRARRFALAAAAPAQCVGRLFAVGGLGAKGGGGVGAAASGTHSCSFRRGRRHLPVERVDLLTTAAATAAVLQMVKLLHTGFNPDEPPVPRQGVMPRSVAGHMPSAFLPLHPSFYSKVRARRSLCLYLSQAAPLLGVDRGVTALCAPRC